MKNLKSVQEKFQKIFGKVRHPPQIAIWGWGVCKYIYCMFNQSLPDVKENLKSECLTVTQLSALAS